MVTTGVQVPEVLLPAPGVDLARWAVVACDQYTSQPDYWQRVEREVGDAPSTLNLIFPEVYLGATPEDDAPRIARIHAAMHDTLDRGLLRARRGLILVQRTTTGPHGPRRRTGLIAAIDLDQYDYRPGSQSLVRATEGTILERLPPRIRIREGAPLELPHVMLLIDDPDRTVIEPLAARAQSLETLYDVELMQGGGHVVGRAVDAAGEASALAALEALADPERFRSRHGDRAVLLFAVGDGNHSLATAKAVWEKTRASLSPAEQAVHPARYALVEIVNVHDEGLDFEPIHRVLFDARRDLLEALRVHFGAQLAFHDCAPSEIPARVSGGSTHRVGFVRQGQSGIIEITRPGATLPVATFQAFLDGYLAEGGAHSIDYVHGTDAVLELGQRPGNVGLYLPAMAKSDLFRTVILEGALPRKTFSMGEAHEKRYYLECRRIVP